MAKNKLEKDLASYTKRMQAQAKKSEEIIKEAESKGGLDELKQLVKVANQRLVRLEREAGKGSWAAKKLEKRMEQEGIEAWTESDRVAFSVKKLTAMTPGQQAQYKKALTTFIMSETSTKTGIEKAKLTTQKALGDKYNVTDQEAQAMYQVVENKQFENLFTFISPSEFWAIYDDIVKTKGGDADDMVNAIKSNFHVSINDEDLKEAIEKMISSAEG